MPDAKLLSLARSLRARAQEVLAQAEIMENAEAQQTMREIAASYERLAQRLEYEAGGADERYRTAGAEPWPSVRQTEPAALPQGRAPGRAL